MLAHDQGRSLHSRRGFTESANAAPIWSQATHERMPMRYDPPAPSELPVVMQTTSCEPGIADLQPNAGCASSWPDQSRWPPPRVELLAQAGPAAPRHSGARRLVSAKRASAARAGVPIRNTETIPVLLGRRDDAHNQPVVPSFGMTASAALRYPSCTVVDRGTLEAGVRPVGRRAWRCSGAAALTIEVSQNLPPARPARGDRAPG